MWVNWLNETLCLKVLNLLLYICNQLSIFSTTVTSHIWKLHFEELSLFFSHCWDYYWEGLALRSWLAGLEALWCGSGLTAGLSFFPWGLRNGRSRSFVEQMFLLSSKPDYAGKITAMGQNRTVADWMGEGQQKQIRLNKATTSWNLVSLWGLKMKGILTLLQRLKGEQEALVWVLVSGSLDVWVCFHEN